MPGLEVLHWSFSFWLLPEEGSELLPAVSLSDRLLRGFPCSQPLIRAPRAVSGSQLSAWPPVGKTTVHRQGWIQV